MRRALEQGAMGKLEGRKVAIIAVDGFEESELTSPKAELEREGARAEVLSLHEGMIRGWRAGDWAGEVRVDRLIADAVSDDYDALLVPGGVLSPDTLRREEDVIRLVQEFFDAGKPIAAICHGPQVLAETGELDGRKLTSFSSIRTDLINAGAAWVDAEVVEDENLVTSRSPEDLPAFNAKIVEAFREPQAPGDGLGTVQREVAELTRQEAPVPASFTPSRRRRAAAQPRKHGGAPSRPESGRALARQKQHAPRGRRAPGTRSGR
ncbi:MAG: type 1 glutamine amidotransferase [Myxococcaceae bacterium]|nr:type 1 glutamine amidotransferase [Myxococcaceae bacterium]